MSHEPSKTVVGVESFQRILRILQVATSSLEPKVLFRNVVDSILKEFPHFYHVSVFLVFKHSGVLAPMAIAGDTPEVFVDKFPGGYTQKLDVGLLGRAYKTARTVLVNDVTADPGYHSAVAPTTLSELCVPLRVAGEVIGILNLESLQRSAFAKEDVEFFEILAEHLANAVRSSLVQDQLASSAGAPAELADPQRAAERTWRDVVNRLPVPILKVGTDGAIVFANDAALKRAGQAKDGLAGRRFEELLEAAARDACRKALLNPDGKPFEARIALGAPGVWLAFPMKEGKPPYACLYKLKD